MKTLQHIALTWLLAGTGCVAQAHPIVSTDINRHATLTLSRQTLRLHYIYNMLEVAAVNEGRMADTDADGEVDKEERERYAQSWARELTRALQITLAGRPLALDLLGVHWELGPAPFGLNTWTLTADLEARMSVDDPATDADPAAAVLTYEDHLRSREVGWKEIVLRSTDDVVIRHANVASHDSSARLTDFAAMSALPNPDQRAARAMLELAASAPDFQAPLSAGAGAATAAQAPSGGRNGAGQGRTALPSSTAYQASRSASPNPSTAPPAPLTATPTIRVLPPVASNAEAMRPSVKNGARADSPKTAAMDRSARSGEPQTYAVNGAFSATGSASSRRGVSESGQSAPSERSLVTGARQSADDAPMAPAMPPSAATASAWQHYALPFFRLGMHHIATGWDHLAFLLGLMLFRDRLRRLIWVVTAFTLAHSLTLALAALGWVNPPGPVIEVLIALSIAYVGILAIWKPTLPHGPLIAFGFGLMHGFGFAGALAETLGAIDTGGWLVALASFNIGIECFQITLVVLITFLLRKLDDLHPSVLPRRVMAAGVALMGAWWTVERLMTL